MIDVAIRAMTADDLGYVYDTWEKTMRAEYPDMRTGDFGRFIRDRAGALLYNHHEVRKIVAHPAHEPMVIWGWAMGDQPPEVWMKTIKPTLYYGYVREQHRRQGIFRRMVKQIGFPSLDDMLVRNLTDDGRALKRRFGWRYVPVP